MFGTAASVVAGKEVAARYWSRPDWERLMVEERAYTRGKVNETVLGFASAGGERLSLAPPVCRDLRRLAEGEALPNGGGQRYALALAVATLAHESVHAFGIADEAPAECHGIQWLARTAEALGADRAVAAALRDAYWSRYEALPPVYRSSECRDGGELDLDGGSGRFP